MESRIEILDRLSKQWGKSTGCVNFDDFLDFYDNAAITHLVHIAMGEYDLQTIKQHNKKEDKKEGEKNCDLYDSASFINEYCNCDLGDCIKINQNVENFHKTKK